MQTISVRRRTHVRTTFRVRRKRKPKPQHCSRLRRSAMPRVLGSALRPSYASSVALATSAVSPTRRLKKRRTMKKADDGLELCCRVVRRHLRSALFTLLRHAVMKHAATKSSPAACDTCARHRAMARGLARWHVSRRRNIIDSFNSALSPVASKAAAYEPLVPAAQRIAEPGTIVAHEPRRTRARCASPTATDSVASLHAVSPPPAPLLTTPSAPLASTPPPSAARVAYTPTPAARMPAPHILQTPELLRAEARLAVASQRAAELSSRAVALAEHAAALGGSPVPRMQPLPSSPCSVLHPTAAAAQASLPPPPPKQHVRGAQTPQLLASPLEASAAAETTYADHDADDAPPLRSAARLLLARWHTQSSRARALAHARMLRNHASASCRRVLAWRRLRSALAACRLRIRLQRSQRARCLHVAAAMALRRALHCWRSRAIASPLHWQRARRFHLLAPQMPRAAMRRSLRTALTRWASVALAHTRCAYATYMRCRDTLAACMMRWRRWRATTELTVARAAAAEHVLRRALCGRLPGAIVQWQLSSARSRTLAHAAAVQWPGMRSSHCEGLRARWRRWLDRVEVLCARTALLRAVAQLAANRSLGMAVLHWHRCSRRQAAFQRRDQRALDAMGQLRMCDAWRTWRRVHQCMRARQSPSHRAYTVAVARWRTEAKRRCEHLALLTVWRWRVGTRRRLRCWQRWRLASSEAGALDQQSRLVACERATWFRLGRAWMRLVTACSVPGARPRLRILAIRGPAASLTMKQRVRQWASRVQLWRGTAAINAAAYRLLLTRQWQRWTSKLAGLRAVAAKCNRLLSRLTLTQGRTPCVRTSVVRTLARWRRSSTIARRETRARAVLHQERVRDAWRVWRRRWDVRAAISGRRQARQRLWAICRAWGRWRRHYAMGGEIY